MKHLKHVTILVALVITLVGCATIKHNYVDPTGRKLPDPHYTLQVIGEPLYFTFYYSAYEKVKDVDGSEILEPIYLDFLKFHTIDRNKVQGLTLHIEVRNPEEIEFGLYEKIQMKTGGGNVNWTEVQKGGQVNRSNLPYRQFVYSLPFGKETKIVDYLVSVYLENNEVARIGHFRYQIEDRKEVM